MYRVILIMLFLWNSLSAQNFSGRAEYITKLNEEEFKKQAFSDPNMDPVMKKFIEDKMKQKLQKNYVLNFNQYLSIYQENQTINIDKETIDNSWSPYGIDLKYFKNLKSQKSIIQKDLLGKYFFIEDDLEKFEWQLLNQTRKIGDYNCFSAKLIIKPSQEEITNYEAELIEYEKNKTNFMKPIIPEDKIITVWYTTEIPVSMGPDKYWGLPGLILEVNDGKTITQCSKIILSGKEIKIDFPKENLISPNNYNKIVEEKIKQMED